MGNLRCKWVHDRLPLLAGDDLRGMERRRVERHLIGCSRCRHDRAALEQSLGVLHAVAAEPPARPDAPSLWPELARQIRESRRPARGSLGTFPLALPRWLMTPWPAPAMGVGLALVVATLVVLGAIRQIDVAESELAENARPIAAPAPRSLAAPAPALVVAEVAAPASPDAKPANETPVAAESVPAPQLGYDLDHAMPMGVEARGEGKQPTF